MFITSIWSNIKGNRVSQTYKRIHIKSYGFWLRCDWLERISGSEISAISCLVDVTVNTTETHPDYMKLKGCLMWWPNREPPPGGQMARVFPKRVELKKYKGMGLIYSDASMDSHKSNDHSSQ